MNGREKTVIRGFMILGIACIAWGLWIPAKAKLSQVLIRQAWSEAKAGAQNPPPWPWADTWPVAKLSVPRLDAEVFVLAHASGEALAFGPAHVTNSAAPGDRDNVVVAGHRDTHFAFLQDLLEGDRIELESTNGSAQYEIVRMEIVHESRTEILERSGRPELTLITCFPFDAIVPGGPLRYVVHAAALPADADISAHRSHADRYERPTVSPVRDEPRSRGSTGPRSRAS